MRISVVIPCYNAAAYLGQAVGSLLDQTRLPDEVIVVDDGSTDGSLDIALRLRGSFGERLTVLSERSGSASRTRNLGALAATGDALMFLDADDVLAPDTLAALEEALSTHPGGIAVCPWYRLELVDGRWVELPASCPPRRRGQDPLSGWLTGWYRPPCSVLWSRRAFERAGRWDEHWNPNDDGDLMMRALAAGVPFVETSAGAGYYRRIPQGESSLSGARYSREGLAARLSTVRKIAWWLDEEGRLDEYREPLSAAFGQLAQDARGDHPVLRRQAGLLASRYQPARFTRAREGAYRTLHRWVQRVRLGLRHRLARWLGGRDGHDRRGREICFGMATAEQALAGDRVDGGSPDIIHRPTVSVIIPTYNRAPLLARALDSVLAQTLEDLEVLVVDDGSTDETEATVTRHHDPRVRYLRQPTNQGVAAARNRGLRGAGGQFIAFLDSDDEWFPDKLAKQVQRLRELPESVGLVYGGVESDDGRGNHEVQLPSRRGDVYRDMLVRNVIHGGGSNVVIRRAVVATAGYFDEQLPAVEDYDYWLRVTRFFQVDYVDEPVMRYHDPRGFERRSLAVRNNLDARMRFYRKHRSEMRRAGVAHLFLVTNARRHLSPAYGDVRGARRLALQALREAPTSSEAYRVVALTVIPRRVLALTQRLRAPAPSGTAAMRIMLYTPTDPAASGGVQTVCTQLAEDLRSRGHTVRTVWSRPVSGRELAVHRLVYPWTDRGLPVPSAVLPAFRALLGLAFDLARFRPDVVNVHFLQPEVAYFVWLRRLFGYELVLSAHGSDVLLPWYERPLRRYVPEADVITAVTRAVAERIEAYPGVPIGSVRVIPNGVDNAFWGAVADPSDVPRRSATILTVGRLRSVKGHDVLLEAFSGVHQSAPHSRLVLIGDGERRYELERLAQDLGVAETTTFLGQLPPEEVRERMSQARVFVLPSRSEGMPLAVLEAMAAGLPVVASRVGGIPELLGPAGGLMVPPDDSEGLAAALISLLEDPGLALSLAEAGVRRARLLDLSDVGAAYEAAFRGV